MQPFTCPQCGHKSTFDPWAKAAHCPRCGFSPPTGGPTHGYVRWANRYAYQPYLDELLAFWQGRHAADPAFVLETPDDGLIFFAEYQRALGEDPRLRTGSHVQYVRETYPNRQEILIFVGAYFWLRRGDRVQARRDLRSLTLTSPRFVEPWLWLSATTDDREEILGCLERATRLDAGHPLARDAMALAQGEIVPGDGRRALGMTRAQCTQCGGALQYRPGEDEVQCSYCGHQVELQLTNVIDGQARPVHHLRLERRYQGHNWAEARRIVRCQGCGAELTMTHHLARHCAFCGSANVLVEDNDRVLQQPDAFLPFELDEQQAGAAIREGARSAWQRLQSLWGGRGSSPEIAELQGVYLPIWVFDAMLEASQWSSSFVGPRKGASHLLTYENQAFPAVDSPPPSLLRERVFPFHLQSLVPYEPHFLADWPARLYNLDVELVAEEASTVLQACARRARPRAARGSQADVTAQVLGVTYQLVLLPVWLALVSSSEGLYWTVVNGQTGRVAYGPAGAADERYLPQ